MVEKNNLKNNVIVNTSNGLENGQDKCPKCGSTDISTNVNSGKLKCAFCRYEFAPEQVEGFVNDISQLKGEVIGSGAKDIEADTNDVMTLKCTSCGAEVVIDTASATQARCHWCRNTLSINEQLPNGSIPDVILPFGITKEEAEGKIRAFVNKRKFYANSKFKSEFTTENIMGVYFPYMLVDVNAKADFSGQGEHQTRKYFRGSGNNQKVYYDADLYYVTRKFDLAIKGLSIESNSHRLNINDATNTNNVINAIMPFDVENCVKYNANYLKGYTSERRDVNIEELRTIIDTQSKDIVRFAANETLKEYDRGVKWENEQVSMKGQQWKTAYLPVWLYSYQQVKGNNKVLHYVAVNARTKETMGSIPIDMAKLIVVSGLVEMLGFLAMGVFDGDGDYLFLTAGVIYFIVMLARYRNFNARHTYETDTQTEMSNLTQTDNYMLHRERLTEPMMAGANNRKVNGKRVTNNLANSVLENNLVNSFIDNNSITKLINDQIDKKDNS